MVQFYGAHVSQTKAVSVSVPEDFVLNVVHASLASGKSAVLSVETTSMDQTLIKVVVGTLREQTCDQIKLDLALGSNKAKFSVIGDGVVHLSGYYQPGPPEMEDEANEINRLSVADLTELIQKAAARVSKQNEDELEGEEVEEPTQKKRSHTEMETTWDQDPSSNEDEDKSPPSPQKSPLPTQPKSQPSPTHPSNLQKKKHKKKKAKKNFLNKQH